MKKFILLMSILLFISCKETRIEGDNLYFENPQPFESSELSTIPNIFLGLYQDKDSVFLKIDKNLITRYRFEKSNIHERDLDSMKNDFILRKDKIIFKETNLVFTRKKLGDSIQLEHKNIDTIFQFSASQKVKRYKGNLILNSKFENYWKVNLLTFENKILKFKYFTESDLAFIDSLTINKSILIDSFSYLLKPTKKEFRKILKKDFTTELAYKKVDK